MNDDLDILRGELQDLMDLEEGMTGWEVEFVESMFSDFQAGRWITRKQTEKIHQIWDRMCGNCEDS